jgi:Mycothiol maleylpyruvate isomerase N-terminal domain
MHKENLRLDANVIIPVLEPLHTVNNYLLDLLRSFTATDWSKSTVHPDRNVKDLVAHLLHGSLRRVTSMRDKYRYPTPPIASTDDLIAFIQADNRDFMRGMRRLSPQILIELISVYDQELLALFRMLDPNQDGLGVVWAGEKVSRNWFDIAREYTEKWHHQQQIRDATNREPLYEPRLFEPALETFARGLPFAIRNLNLPDQSRVLVQTTGVVNCCWTLYRDAGTWSLWQGKHPELTSSVTIPAEVAWRVWTKSMDRGEASRQIQAVGDGSVVDPIVSFVAIMA